MLFSYLSSIIGFQSSVKDDENTNNKNEEPKILQEENKKNEEPKILQDPDLEEENKKLIEMFETLTKEKLKASEFPDQHIKKKISF